MLYNDGDTAWRQLMSDILLDGLPISPRGQLTTEVLHTQNIQVDMARPVVTSPERALNYKFMAAEALWILSGSKDLEPLTRFVKRMANYSDDGQTLSGAYGPPIVQQLPYVIMALLSDRDTRQAVLTTWRPSPQPSKDIPCTISMVFSIRDGELHQHVFMRSSDAWLGVPYDMFSFAMIGVKVACEYNRLRAEGVDTVSPGRLTISMTSSHIYDRDQENVRKVLASPQPPRVVPVPIASVLDGRWSEIDASLVALREGLEIQPWMWDLRARVGDLL